MNARDKITCRYRSWRADEDSAITSEASFKARDAFCSPSAAITYTMMKNIKWIECVGNTRKPH